MGTGAGSGRPHRRVGVGDRGPARPGSERGPEGSRWAPAGILVLYPNSCTSAGQRVERHMLHVQLSQNSCLAKDLKRFRKQLEREAGKPEARKCAFILKTLKMPSEYYLFVEEFCKNPGITWVMKLVGKSQGGGMFRKLKCIID